MLALKPGLFPLPGLRCLLFLQAAFHSGFNSLQTLPNGFFTWGPPSTLRHPTGFQEFHGPLGHKNKGILFPQFPFLCLGAALFAPRIRNGVSRGVGPSLWDWQMSWSLMEMDVGTGDTLVPTHRLQC